MDLPHMQGGAPAFTGTLLIDATGEKISMGGSLYIPDGTAKEITRVHFEWGTIIKAGGSALTISLQNLSSASAFPTEPDEVQDQTVAVANGDAAFLTNTWYRSGALSANRSVNPGDFLAVVIEFDGGGRLGADQAIVRAFTAVDTTSAPGNSLKFGGSWTAIGTMPNVIFEFSDGTFGSFTTSQVFAEQLTTHTIDTGSTPDEVALEFTPPFPMKVNGLWHSVSVLNSSSDFELVLYQGTTALQTITVDADTLISTAGRPVRYMFPSEIIIGPGATYYLSIKPTSANDVFVYSYLLNDANHMAVFPGGTACVFNSRSDGGSWNGQDTKRRPACGLYVSAIGQEYPSSRLFLGM
jgi:hypothetical protein